MYKVFLVSIDYNCDGAKPVAVFDRKQYAKQFVQLAGQGSDNYLIQEVEFIKTLKDDDSADELEQEEKWNKLEV